MLHIYHPSPSVKGFAASFWYSDRDDAVFATLIKQSGWDSNTQNGTFKESLKDPNKHINIKFNFTEVAAILDCIDRNRPFTTVHDSEKSSKSINFVPYIPKSKNPEEKSVQSGFSFSITVTDKENNSKNSFYIALKYHEAREVREFLIFFFFLHFRIMRTAQKKYQAGFTPNKEESPIKNEESQTEDSVNAQDEVSEAPDVLGDF
jgi:lysyl-tRNA synthetase class I